MVECQLPKLDVAGSNPVSRSNILKDLVDLGPLLPLLQHLLGNLARTRRIAKSRNDLRAVGSPAIWAGHLTRGFRLFCPFWHTCAARRTPLPNPVAAHRSLS